jgi:uncharacterized protein (DUF2147 family)
MKLKYLFTLLSLLVFGAGLSAQSLDTPAGRWKTVDDETGKAESVIEIYKEGNAYSGRIAKILTGNTDAVCEKCDGKQKNAPILGLVIISDLKNEDEGWSDGKILDPRKGSEYRLSAWYEDNNPDVLFIRGKHWTGLYRTQQWLRAD